MLAHIKSALNIKSHRVGILEKHDKAVALREKELKQREQVTKVGPQGNKVTPYKPYNINIIDQEEVNKAAADEPNRNNTTDDNVSSGDGSPTANSTNADDVDNDEMLTSTMQTILSDHSSVLYSQHAATSELFKRVLRSICRPLILVNGNMVPLSRLEIQQKMVAQSALMASACKVQGAVFEDVFNSAKLTHWPSFSTLRSANERGDCAITDDLHLLLYRNAVKILQAQICSLGKLGHNHRLSIYGKNAFSVTTQQDAWVAKRRKYLESAISGYKGHQECIQRSIVERNMRDAKLHQRKTGRSIFKHHYTVVPVNIDSNGVELGDGLNLSGGYSDVDPTTRQGDAVGEGEVNVSVWGAPGPCGFKNYGSHREYVLLFKILLQQHPNNKKMIVTDNLQLVEWNGTSITWVDDILECTISPPLLDRRGTGSRYSVYGQCNASLDILNNFEMSTGLDAFYTNYIALATLCQSVVMAIQMLQNHSEMAGGERVAIDQSLLRLYERSKVLAADIDNVDGFGQPHYLIQLILDLCAKTIPYFELSVCSHIDLFGINSIAPSYCTAILEKIMKIKSLCEKYVKAHNSQYALEPFNDYMKRLFIRNAQESYRRHRLVIIKENKSISEIHEGLDDLMEVAMSSSSLGAGSHDEKLVPFNLRHLYALSVLYCSIASSLSVSRVLTAYLEVDDVRHEDILYSIASTWQSLLMQDLELLSSITTDSEDITKVLQLYLKLKEFQATLIRREMITRDDKGFEIDRSFRSFVTPWIAVQYEASDKFLSSLVVEDAKGCWEPVSEGVLCSFSVQSLFYYCHSFVDIFSTLPYDTHHLKQFIVKLIFRSIVKYGELVSKTFQSSSEASIAFNGAAFSRLNNMYLCYHGDLFDQLVRSLESKLSINLLNDSDDTIVSDERPVETASVEEDSAQSNYDSDKTSTPLNAMYQLKLHMLKVQHLQVTSESTFKLVAEVAPSVDDVVKSPDQYSVIFKASPSGGNSVSISGGSSPASFGYFTSPDRVLEVSLYQVGKKKDELKGKLKLNLRDSLQAGKHMEWSSFEEPSGIKLYLQYDYSPSTILSSANHSIGFLLSGMIDTITDLLFTMLVPHFEEVIFINPNTTAGGSKQRAFKGNCDDISIDDISDRVAGIVQVLHVNLVGSKGHVDAFLYKKMLLRFWGKVVKLLSSYILSYSFMNTATAKAYKARPPYTWATREAGSSPSVIVSPKNFLASITSFINPTENNPQVLCRAQIRIIDLISNALLEEVTNKDIGLNATVARGEMTELVDLIAHWEWDRGLVLVT